MHNHHSSPVNPEIGIRREIFEIQKSEMSRVFYAESSERELVVVKSVGEDADDFLKRRLAAEAKILGVLEHPQIPELISDDTDYIAPHFKMKPVWKNRDATRSIPFLLNNPDPYQAADVIHSVLTPVGYVHSERFLHRDVKPSNMIVGLGTVSLVDFGATSPRPYNHLVESGQMAEGSKEHIKARNHKQAYSAGEIGTGKRVIGSLEYLSPEEVKNKNPDITSDIYNIGTTLYKLLYGRFAHSGFIYPTPPRPTDSLVREEVEDAISEDVVYASDDKRIPEGRAEEEIDFTVPEDRFIPADLIEVIERATQREPDDRYQSAEEMQEDIERYLHS